MEERGSTTSTFFSLSQPPLLHLLVPPFCAAGTSNKNLMRHLHVKNCSSSFLLTFLEGLVKELRRFPRGKAKKETEEFCTYFDSDEVPVLLLFYSFMVQRPTQLVSLWFLLLHAASSFARSFLNFICVYISILDLHIKLPNFGKRKWWWFTLCKKLLRETGISTSFDNRFLSDTEFYIYNWCKLKFQNNQNCEEIRERITSR